MKNTQLSARLPLSLLLPNDLFWAVAIETVIYMEIMSASVESEKAINMGIG